MIALPSCSEQPPEFSDTSERGKVYFVCRSQYESPLGHRVVEFPSSSLLAWFQENWITPELRKWILDPPQEGAWVPTNKPESEWTDEDVIPVHNYDPIHQHSDNLLKGGVYGFSEIWEAMAKWGAEPPENSKQLKNFVSTINYYGEITFADGALQCLTDDDEIEIAWYLFDEEFAQRHPERVAYLLHPTWELPKRSGTETGALETDPSRNLSTTSDRPADGVVYCVFLSAQDGMTLLEMTGAYRFSGVRLPEFAKFLRSSKVPIEQTEWGSTEPTWPDELILLRALNHVYKADGFAKFLANLDDEALNKKASPAREFSDLRHSLKEPDFLAGSTQSITKDFLQLESHIEASRKEDGSSWIRKIQPPLVQASEHFCQIRFQERLNAKIQHDSDPVDYTWAYMFFDDHWIASNPELAQSILHYASGWQALYKAEPITSR